MNRKERERENKMELFFELGFETIRSSILFARDLFARKFLSFVVVFIFIFVHGTLIQTCIT